jgi:hypothetical protein
VDQDFQDDKEDAQHQGQEHEDNPQDDDASRCLSGILTRTFSYVIGVG